MKTDPGSSTRKVARYLNKRLGIERGPNRQLTNDHFDDHHLWYPRWRYANDTLASLFRNLPCQRVVTNRGLHCDFHIDDRYPKPPSRRQMRKQVLKCRQNGCKGGTCVMPIQVLGTIIDDIPSRIIFVDNNIMNSRLHKTKHLR